MALGHHLCAHQHVNLAGMHLGQLGLQAAGVACAVGVDARHVHWRAVGILRRLRAGPAHVGQQLHQMLLQPLGAASHRRDVLVATFRAAARHWLGIAAVVATQAAVDLVKHAKRAAMRAGTAPVAGAALQHRRITAPVQEHQALFAGRDALAYRLEQRRGDHGPAGLVIHVDPAHQWQPRLLADATRHLQPLVASTLGGGTAVVPALQRWRGRAQNHLGALQVSAVDRQIACRIPRALLLLIARVVLLVDHDQGQRGHGREHRHACAEHDARGAQVRRQPAAQALWMGHAAVQRHHGTLSVQRVKALLKPVLQLGREVDLGHHHQSLGLGLAGQQLLHTLQVDLGLATAGGTKQQKTAVRLPDLRHHGLLLGA